MWTERCRYSRRAEEDGRNPGNVNVNREIFNVAKTA